MAPPKVHDRAKCVESIRRHNSDWRGHVVRILRPWVDGPIDPGEDLFDNRQVILLDIGDGYRFYRKKPELASQSASIKREFDLALRLNIETWRVDNNLGPNGSLQLLVYASYEMGRVIEKLLLPKGVITQEHRREGGRKSGKWKNNPAVVELARATYRAKMEAGCDQGPALKAARAKLKDQFDPPPSISTIRGLVGLPR